MAIVVSRKSRVASRAILFSIGASATDVPRLIRDDVSKQANATVACMSFKLSPVRFDERFGRIFFDLAMAAEFALGLQL